MWKYQFLAGKEIRGQYESNICFDRISNVFILDKYPVETIQIFGRGEAIVSLKESCNYRGKCKDISITKIIRVINIFTTYSVIR